MTKSFFEKWGDVIRKQPVRTRPLYASVEGGNRLEVAARAACRASDFEFCDTKCVDGCKATEEMLDENGSFEIACAVVLAIDRYDER